MCNSYVYLCDSCQNLFLINRISGLKFIFKSQSRWNVADVIKLKMGRKSEFQVSFYIYMMLLLSSILYSFLFLSMLLWASSVSGCEISRALDFTNYPSISCSLCKSILQYFSIFKYSEIMLVIIKKKLFFRSIQVKQVIYGFNFLTRVG